MGVCIGIHRKILEQLKQDKPGWVGETTEKAHMFKNAYLDLNV